jgi:hypothetical protein
MEEIKGLGNLKERLKKLLGRKIEKKEKENIDILGENEFLRIDNYEISMKPNDFAMYLVAKIQ